MQTPNSQVYCGDQTRGLHATTSQVVQPNPSFKLCTESDGSEQAIEQSNANKKGFMLLHPQVPHINLVRKVQSEDEQQYCQ